jgi:translation initiation factor IF-2
MSKKLVQVAAELNVGTKTIVEFLTGKGFEVIDKPTAKISEEMLEILVKNFQKSIAIKEQAEQITIGSRVVPKKEEKPFIKEEPKPLFKKEAVKEVVKEVVVEQVEEPVTEEKEYKLSGPKILGKIDLDANKKTPKVEKKVEEPIQKTEEKKETVKIEEVKIEAAKIEEVKKEEVKKEEIKETPAVETTVKVVETKEDTHIKTVSPQLKGLKILGKITIEDNKNKKKKKGKKESPAEVKADGSSEPKKESEDIKKKRRKRTKISKGEPVKDENRTVFNNSGGNTTGNNTSGNNAGNNAGNNTGNNAGNNAGNKKKKKKDKRKEITDKEVGDKLKETMARVQGGNKVKKFGSTRSARDEKKEQARIRLEEESEEDMILQVTEFISVSELAGLLDISPAEIITMCMQVGHFVSINQRLDAELIELIAAEYGYEVEFISAEEQIEIVEEEEDAEEDLEPRAPIVTVMGHVDHGKTSLLDYIRKANVASGEAGGITQHIGAYEVNVHGKGNITFLDTPGHEAFTAMRARGAKVTDIAVIIISADDSVMPQTREAISHAQAAGVPIVFAINKIDKDGANPDKIKQELAGMNYLIEEWGGKYQSQDISAKKGLHVDLLLEKILLEAEMLNLRANHNRRALGTILEASIEKGRGYVAKVLIQNGTLGIGDPIVAGQHFGRVKAMFNEQGLRVKEAGPSTPVLVLGLDGAPQAGEKVQEMESERDGKDLANKRAQIIRQQQIRATRRITLDDITRRLKVGNFQQLNLIVKGDMDGSVEALSDALLKLKTEAIQTNIIYKAVGPITESDVNLAAASDAIIIGFQVRPNPLAKKLAEQEGVEVKMYSVIYDAIDEIKSALEGMLEPKQVEEVTGLISVQAVFNITKVGNVAGCLVQSGKVTRNSFVRVIRNSIVVFPKKEGVNGELSSLKRLKDNVSEVKAGFECGLTIRNFDDFKEGDEVEVYELKEVKQKL